ncbi:hypothetical protein VTJ49DRAFT_1435 [Mycothermus thermophilus]|uniref:Ribosome biogenesis regulatory protein n=1 Tax=Humicola insolens TaxID=85995 RepID=A0ABR3VCX4_HUMIN
MSATTTAPASKPAKLPVTVDKPTPYTFDLGLLLANDPNPVSVPQTSDRATLESHLASVARDGAQVLINQLLTTCAISSTPQGVLLNLPPATTPLPREKPVPDTSNNGKPETKWSAFAKRRGIKPKTREQRRNLQYNEATGEWERKWGYKGANKAGQDDPIIEVKAKDEEKRMAEGRSVRGDKRREIRERVKRNERRMRRNLRNQEKAGGK